MENMTSIHNVGESLIKFSSGDKLIKLDYADAITHLECCEVCVDSAIAECVPRRTVARIRERFVNVSL